jgi:hypothetical protein
MSSGRGASTMVGQERDGLPVPPPRAAARLGPRGLGAVLLALLAAAAVNGWIAVVSPAGPLADLTHYKHWTRLVTVEGMHAAYSGEYPETYAIYPPVTLLTFRAAGAMYQQWVDPTFDLDRALASHELSVLLRLQALIFHLLVGLAVFAVARHAVPFRAAYVALLAYLFNPGVIFDVAQWGQPDPVFGLFVLLALAAAAWGASVTWSRRGGPVAPDLEQAVSDMKRLRPNASFVTYSFGVRGGGRLSMLAAASAGLCIVVAAFAKPQAWVFLPLVGGLVWRRGGVRGVAAAAVAGAVAAFAVAFPYLRHGTLGELIGLPRAISAAMPVVTANAHDLWWLISNGAARWPLDQEPFLGPLSYRLVAVGLVGAFALLALARALREPTFGAVFTAGAYTGFGFFMAMTQVHENHMYVVFPLLAVAAAVDRRLWPLYAVLAVTWCANMLLHDFDLAEQVVAPLLPWSLEQAQWANSLVNTLALAGWTAWLAADTARAWRGQSRPAAPAAATAEA